MSHTSNVPQNDTDNHLGLYIRPSTLNAGSVKGSLDPRCPLKRNLSPTATTHIIHIYIHTYTHIYIYIYIMYQIYTEVSQEPRCLRNLPSAQRPWAHRCRRGPLPQSPQGHGSGLHNFNSRVDLRKRDQVAMWAMVETPPRAILSRFE